MRCSSTYLEAYRSCLIKIELIKIEAKNTLGLSPQTGADHRAIRFHVKRCRPPTVAERGSTGSFVSQQRLVGTEQAIISLHNLCGEVRRAAVRNSPR